MYDEHIEVKDFCPVCSKKVKINIEINMQEKTIGEAYCQKCNNKIPYAVEKYRKNVEEIIETENELNEYKVDEKDYVFESNKPIYDFESFISPLIILPILLLMAFPFFGLYNLICEGFVVGIVFSIVFGLVGGLLLIMVILSILHTIKHKEWANYLKTNGKVFSGKVKRIIQQEHNDRDGHPYTDYYFEIEYIDSDNNQQSFTTPKLYQQPQKAKNITCNVYVVEELPSQYKKILEASNSIALDFH